MCVTCHFLLAGGEQLAYTRPMPADDSILAAYAITALLVAVLCVATLLRARRVRKSLAAQEHDSQS